MIAFILGSFFIGMILGGVGITGWIYWKDRKDKKYLKEHEEEIKQDIEENKQRMKEVKNARESEQQHISARKKREHQDNSTASGRKFPTPAREQQNESQGSSGGQEGVQISNGFHSLRP